MHRQADPALLRQAPRKQHIGRFTLTICLPRFIVLSSTEPNIPPADSARCVGHARQIHDPRALVRLFQQALLDQCVSQDEMADMVRSELRFKAIDSRCIRARHGGGVVDQNVDARNIEGSYDGTDRGDGRKIDYDGQCLAFGDL